MTGSLCGFHGTVHSFAGESPQGPSREKRACPTLLLTARSPRFLMRRRSDRHSPSPSAWQIFRSQRACRSGRHSTPTATTRRGTGAELPSIERSLSVSSGWRRGSPKTQSTRPRFMRGTVIGYRGQPAVCLHGSVTRRNRRLLRDLSLRISRRMSYVRCADHSPA
jgi:hypothetical protein